ncbi:MAG: hypothetical protein AAGA42_01640 [Actinomycetota bacterium]
MADDRVSTSFAARAPFGNGASIGVGSLPHTDAAAAAAFAIGEFDIATVPTLPRRTPHAAMLAQAATVLAGAAVSDGELTIDGDLAVEPLPTITEHDAFADLASFLDLGAKVRLDGSPVKWQFVGSVTLGRALVEAGVAPDEAFAVASAVVADVVPKIEAAIRAALPNSPQLVLFDEPWLVDLMTDDFPIPPDHAIDVLSSAMAAPSTEVVTGVHCCGPFDVATMTAAGPQVISTPVDDSLLGAAGYLAEFVDSGGVVAWGVVPTDGPVADHAHRWWRRLSDLWCALVQRGCDPVQLRQHSLVSTECGLAGHTVSVARTLTRQTGEVSRHVRDQAAATRLTLGA